MTTQPMIRRTENILAAATILTINTPAALRALEESIAGWPTSTPGASNGSGSLHAGALDQQVLDDLTAHPATPHVATVADGFTADRYDPTSQHELGHLPTGRQTPVETAAGQHDRARNDLERFRKAINDVNHHLRIASNIAHLWGTTRIDETTVKSRLAAADAIWCTNCAQHDFRNPRREGGTVCEYCHGFKTDYPQYKCYPPKGVLEIWTTRGKCWPNDVHRVMRELKTTTKEAKRKDRTPDWRTKPDPARRIASDPSAADARRERRLSA